MPHTQIFCNYLKQTDYYLSSKFEQYITVQIREGKKVLVLQMGTAPEIDIDELISLKYIWEEFGFIDPEVDCDFFMITGGIKNCYN